MNSALLLSLFIRGLVLNKSEYILVFIITFIIIVVNLTLRILVVKKVAIQYLIIKPPTY